jgi:hypothetical protein
MDNSIKDALKPNLTRPLDKAAMSNDSATLRALTGMLNNPAITGAVVPKGETTALPTTALPPGSIPDHSDVSPPSNIGGAAPFPSAQTANAPGSALPPAREVPAKETPAAAVKVGLRLLFTGRGLSDTAHAIGAIEYNISAPVFKLAQKFFNESVFSDVNSISAPGSVSFLATIKAWGAGEISAAFPITPARAIFVQMIRSLAGMADALPAGPNWKRFGSDEGFWIDACVHAANEDNDSSGRRVVITGIASKFEYDYIRSQGYSHWHIMARPGVGGNVDLLSGSFDNDVTKQVSVQRNGPKLRCIWKDTTPPISGRLWAVADFVLAASLSAIAESASLE